MDVQIFWEGTDITNKVTNYSRKAYICTGIGSLTLDVVKDATEYTTYDEIVLYEEGVKKGTYYVSSNDYNTRSHTRNLVCQDASKKLTDYFIAETTTILDEATYAKDMIVKYLDLATVSYVFDTEEGNSLISNNTALGPGTAMEVIAPLLSQCGWYIYFDADNLCHINHIEISPEDYVYIADDTKILSFKENINDKMLRNRAVVWGTSNTITMGQVFADKSVITPWDYDDTHKRTVVVSNPNIQDNTTAGKISQQLLDEFSRLTHEKEVEVVGAPDITIGDTIMMSSKYYSGACLVTSIDSNVSPSGMKTILYLDQRCPKLIAYFDWGGYVYIGTLGDGVWRKRLKGIHTWEDYSDGLETLNVTDLFVNAGLLACVADNKLYTRNIVDSTWTPFELDSVMCEGEILYGLDCMGCSIHPIDHMIYAVYNLAGEYTYTNGVLSSTEDSKAWLVKLNPVGQDYTITQIDISGDPACSSLSIKNSSIKNLLSVGSGSSLTFIDKYGNRNCCRSDSKQIVGLWNLIPANSYSQYNTVKNIKLDPSYLSIYFYDYLKLSDGNWLYGYEKVGMNSPIRHNWRENTTQALTSNPGNQEIYCLIAENKTLHVRYIIGTCKTDYYVDIIDWENDTITEIDSFTMYLKSPSGCGFYSSYPAYGSLVATDDSSGKAFLLCPGYITENSGRQGLYLLTVDYKTETSLGLTEIYSNTADIPASTSSSLVESTNYIYGAGQIYGSVNEIIYIRIDKSTGSIYYNVVEYESTSSAWGSVVTPDFSHDAVIYTGYDEGENKLLRLNNDLSITTLDSITVSDIYHLISSKNKVMYYASGYKLYDVYNGFIGTFPDEIDFISSNADDYDDSIVVTLGNLIYSYSSSNLNDKTLLYTLPYTPEYFIVLSGQKIISDSSVVYYDANYDLSYFAVLEEENNTFTLVDTTAEAVKLEIDRDFPVVANSAVNASETLKYGSLYLSKRGEYNTFNFVMPYNAVGGGSYYKDVRTFISDQKNYLLFCNGDTVNPYSSSVKQIELPASMDGVVLQDAETIFSDAANCIAIETTNYNYYSNPYIFIATTSSFFQRDKDTAGFVERNTNLPLSEISVIRTDDII